MSIFYPRHATPNPGFSSLFRMLDDFEKYAQSSLGNPLNNPFSGPTASSSGLPTIAPKFDVTETDEAYSLQGELPGVPAENVTVEFTDPQTMVIRGKVEKERTEGDPSLARIEGGEERKKIEEGKGGGKEKGAAARKKEGEGKGEGKGEPKYWLSERSYGEFSRVFNFPSGVNQEKVEAKFENGLLNVKVPKETKKGAKKIEIK